MSQPITESTVARIAGNIYGSILRARQDEFFGASKPIVVEAVAAARAIVAEVERTKPQPDAREEV